MQSLTTAAMNLVQVAPQEQFAETKDNASAGSREAFCPSALKFPPG
jgi:hypothetical protein